MIEIEVAKQVADIIFGYAQTENREADKPWLQDRRNKEINPYYRKTKQGLFLEMYYGIARLHLDSAGQLWFRWQRFGIVG